MKKCSECGRRWGTLENCKYKAVIIFEGKPGEREPSARLENGQEQPMGWNMGQTIPVGTQGTAQYVSTGSMGLWQFTQDKQ